MLDRSYFSLLKSALLSFIILALSLFVLSGCDYSHSPEVQSSETQDEGMQSNQEQEDVLADNSWGHEVDARIYLKDNIEESAALEFVSTMNNIEGIHSVSYIDQKTAEQQIEDSSSTTTVPHAYIEYVIEPEQDKFAIDQEIFSIDNLKEASLNNSSVISLSWSNDGETHSTGEYTYEEVDTVLSDGSHGYGITFKPIKQ